VRRVLLILSVCAVVGILLLAVSRSNDNGRDAPTRSACNGSSPSTSQTSFRDGYAIFRRQSVRADDLGRRTLPWRIVGRPIEVKASRLVGRLDRTRFYAVVTRGRPDHDRIQLLAKSGEHLMQFGGSAAVSPLLRTAHPVGTFREADGETVLALVFPDAIRAVEVTQHDGRQVTHATPDNALVLRLQERPRRLRWCGPTGNEVWPSAAI
jgi:hypothetical protein